MPGQQVVEVVGLAAGNGGLDLDLAEASVDGQGGEREVAGAELVLFLLISQGWNELTQRLGGGLLVDHRLLQGEQGAGRGIVGQRGQRLGLAAERAVERVERDARPWESGGRARCAARRPSRRPA